MPLTRHDKANGRLLVVPRVSTHMPLTRHDRVLCDNGTFVIVSTHMPLTRHDGWDASPWVWVIVSTHMPLTRHDGGLWNELSGRIEFLLTCLLRGMTRNRWQNRDQKPVFLLTCLLRGMTLLRVIFFVVSEVSTHMPLARHDASASALLSPNPSFYSHASCEA